MEKWENAYKHNCKIFNNFVWFIVRPIVKRNPGRILRLFYAAVSRLSTLTQAVTWLFHNYCLNTGLTGRACTRLGILKPSPPPVPFLFCASSPTKKRLYTLYWYTIFIQLAVGLDRNMHISQQWGILHRLTICTNQYARCVYTNKQTKSKQIVI